MKKLVKVSLFGQKRGEPEEDKQFKARLLEALSSNSKDVKKQIEELFETLLTQKQMGEEGNEKRGQVSFKLASVKDQLRDQPLAKIIEDLSKASGYDKSSNVNDVSVSGKSPDAVKSVLEGCIKAHYDNMERVLGDELFHEVSKKNIGSPQLIAGRLASDICKFAKENGITLSELPERLRNDTEIQGLFRGESLGKVNKILGSATKDPMNRAADFIDEAFKEANGMSTESSKGQSLGK